MKWNWKMYGIRLWHYCREKREKSKCCFKYVFKNLFEITMQVKSLLQKEILKHIQIIAYFFFM